MSKPSISLMPLQRSGDGRVTAFHWILNYQGAEAQFWILPTELPRPSAMGDLELAGLELDRFLEAIEECCKSKGQTMAAFPSSPGGVTGM